MRELADLEERLEQAADDTPLAELEDLLSEGYARALAGDARRRRLDERIEDLIARVDEPEAALEVRRLSVERRTLDRALAELRARLELERARFIRLGGGRENSA